jgi:hypothetical protein
VLVIAIGIGLVTSPSAVASGDGVTRGDVGRLVDPHQQIAGLDGGDVIGEGWSRLLSLPADVNPWFGNGEHCLKLGRADKVLLVVVPPGPAPCTVKRGTAVLVIGITSFCDTAEPPPYFAVGERAQRRCALASLEPTTGIGLSIDGQPSVEIMQRRYQICAPQREVQLLADNLLGVEPQLATFVACGWVVWVTDLPVGLHTISSLATFDDGTSHLYQPEIEIVR